MRDRENLYLKVGESNFSSDDVNIEFIPAGKSFVNKVTQNPQTTIKIDCINDCFMYNLGGSVKVNGESTLIGDAGYIEGTVLLENDQMWPMEYLIFGNIKIQE